MKTNIYLSIIISFFFFSTIAQESNQKNVLLIIVDDLRPALPTYGATQVVAPNITSFSNDAVQFNNAFVNIPTCGASRASILTGIRPTREYYKKYYTSIDEDMPQAITISELLKLRVTLRLAMERFRITNQIKLRLGMIYGDLDQQPQKIIYWRKISNLVSFHIKIIICLMKRPMLKT